MIGVKLVLITNMKSYMSFGLVPKSVTLSDLERRNGKNSCTICCCKSFIRPTSVFWLYYFDNCSLAACLDSLKHCNISVSVSTQSTCGP